MADGVHGVGDELAFRGISDVTRSAKQRTFVRVPQVGHAVDCLFFHPAQLPPHWSAQWVSMHSHPFQIRPVAYRAGYTFLEAEADFLAPLAQFRILYAYSMTTETP